MKQHSSYHWCISPEMVVFNNERLNPWGGEMLNCLIVQLSIGSAKIQILFAFVLLNYNLRPFLKIFKNDGTFRLYPTIARIFTFFICLLDRIRRYKFAFWMDSWAQIFVLLFLLQITKLNWPSSGHIHTGLSSHAFFTGEFRINAVDGRSSCWSF